MTRTNLAKGGVLDDVGKLRAERKTFIIPYVILLMSLASKHLLTLILLSEALESFSLCVFQTLHESATLPSKS